MNTRKKPQQLRLFYEKDVDDPPDRRVIRGFREDQDERYTVWWWEKENESRSATTFSSENKARIDAWRDYHASIVKCTVF